MTQNPRLILSWVLFRVVLASKLIRTILRDPEMPLYAKRSGPLM